jgi:hypothetical protein
MPETRHTDQEVAEASESLMIGVLSTYAEDDPEDIVPLRQLMNEIGRLCGVELTAGQMMLLDEEITVAELRTRLRKGRGLLAMGLMRP